MMMGGGGGRGHGEKKGHGQRLKRGLILTLAADSSGYRCPQVRELKGVRRKGEGKIERKKRKRG